MWKSWAVWGAAIAASTARAASAQPAGEGAYTLVPAEQRLTLAGVVADAAFEVQAVMAILILATVAAAVVWATSLGKVGKADAKGLAAALGRLRIVRSGAIPLGILTATYVMLSSFIAIANVRPVPSLTVVAPGLAEATLAIMLGLLATTVAIVCERHLEGRIRQAAA